MRAAGLLLAVCAVRALAAGAAPQLAAQAELVAGGELKMRVLAGARGVPPPTPPARTYRLTRGAEVRQVKWYAVDDLWRLRALAGTWKDRRGNVMTLARVKSLVPTIEMPAGFPDGGAWAEKDEIERRLDAAEAAFDGMDAAREAWRAAWNRGDGAPGRFVALKDGRTFYIELDCAEPVRPQDAEKLLAAAAKSLSAMTGGVSANHSSMKWWTEENDQYRFLTNLDRARGGKFIKDAMALMAAMRRAYEFYVPPQRPVGKCTVRVFKTLADYREHLQGTAPGELAFSCGLWDPSREELLIAAEDAKAAQETMRHEAFHQYLHYATGRGDHALWFNEGHACLFESVQYNPAKGTVRVLDAGRRAAWVERNPEAVAAALRRLPAMGREAYYAGDVNLHYVAGWALVYFLERGAYASEAFAPYRAVAPAYLKAMREGADPSDATARAFAPVASRDLAADFLLFWRKHRKQALKARPET